MPETDPSITPVCAACGSDAVIRDAVHAPGSSSKVLVFRRSGLTFGQRPAASTTHARVCGDCGFVMTFADEPGPLWDAYVDRLAHDLDD